MMNESCDTENNRSAGESGFSLILVLALVMMVASVVMIMTVGSGIDPGAERARASGWHLAMVAKAARIFVRDNSTLPAMPYHKTRLAGPAPIDVPIDDLVDAGLLPLGFSEVNALGQTVRVIAANYPLNGAPANATTVATVYIYIEPNATSSPTMMQYLAAAARDQGLDVVAPVFSGATNISEDCDASGAPDVVLWSTGCMDTAEFAQLTGDPAFIQGGLVVPGWRAQTHDVRAMMRFPQPENPGANLMLTNLWMGTPVTDASGACTQTIKVYDPDGAGGQRERDTNICDVYPDDSAIADWRQADRRTDIVNIENMAINRVVANGFSQPVQEVRVIFDAAGGAPDIRRQADSADPELQLMDAKYNEVFGLDGTIQTLNVDTYVSGRLPNPTVAAGPYKSRLLFESTAGVPGNLYMNRFISISSNGATPGGASLVVDGASEVRDLQTPGTINRPVTGGNVTADVVNIESGVTIGTVTATALEAPGVAVAADAVTVTGVATADNVNVTDALDTPRLTADSATVTGAASAVRATLTGTLNANQDTDITTCTGLCPDITP